MLTHALSWCFVSSWHTYLSHANIVVVSLLLTKNTRFYISKSNPIWAFIDENKSCCSHASDLWCCKIRHWASGRKWTKIYRNIYHQLQLDYKFFLVITCKRQKWNLSILLFALGWLMNNFVKIFFTIFAEIGNWSVWFLPWIWMGWS